MWEAQAGRLRNGSLLLSIFKNCWLVGGGGGSGAVG